MDLMSLMIRIGADITGAQKGMEQVQGGMEQTAKKSTGFASKLKSGFKVIATAGAGMAAGVAAATAAVVKLTTAAAQTTDRIDKMSQKIGVSRKTFQEMDFIMSQSGGSVESLQAGMKTLRTTMVAAANGTKASADKFKRLGVAVKDSNGKLRNQEDVMFDTLSALQNVSDETERAALATELFGKAGVELTPLLNSGAGSIDEMRKKAHELGLVLDDDAVDAGVKLTDTIDQVKRSFDAVKTKIGVELMPIVQRVLDIVLENMPTIQTVLGGFFGFLGTIVGGAVNVIGWIAGVVKNFVGYIVDTFGPKVMGVINPIVDAVSGVWTTVKDVLDKITRRISWAWEVSDGDFQKFLGFATMGAPDAIKKLWNDYIFWIIEWVKNGINTLTEKFDDFRENVLPKVTDYISGVFTTAWNAVSTFFTETLPNAIHTVMDVFTAFYDEVIKPLAQFVGHAMMQAWQSIVDYWNGDLSERLSALHQAFLNFKDKVLIPIANFLNAAFTNAWNGIISLFGGDGGVEGEITSVKDAFSFLWENMLKPIAKWVTNSFGAVWKGLETTLNGILDFITGVFSGNWQKAWDGLVSALGGIFGTIKELLKTPINAVIDLLNKMLYKVGSAINKLINGINSKLRLHFSGVDIGWPINKRVAQFDWSPNLQQVNWGWIPRLANGGVVQNGGHAIVGEAGYPEYLRVINGQAIVTPMKNSGTNTGDTWNVNFYQQPGESQEALFERFERWVVQKELRRRAARA